MMTESTTFEPFRKFGAVALAVVLAVGLGACDSDVSSNDSSSMSLQLTDAPAGDLSEAWVDIGTIAMQGEGGEVVLVENPEGPENGFFELTSLAGTTADLVGDVAVPSGSYGQLRIVIDAAALETDDGDVFSFGGAAEALGIDDGSVGTLQAPSIPQTGVKVNLGGLTLESEAKILVLDFDVAESFGREAGASNMWVLEPTITSSELEASGTISGTVSLADGVSIPDCPAEGDERDVSAFVPVAIDPASGDTLASGDVDSEGSYAIDFLEPADYDLGHAPEVTFDGGALVLEANVSPEAVTVESGSEATADYTITSATCEQDDS